MGCVHHPGIWGRGITPLQLPSYQRPSRSRPLIPDGFRHFEGTARSILVYTAFPCSDYYAPSDSPLRHRAFVRRFPLTTSPLLLASAEEPPVFRMEDSNRTL